MVRWCCGGVRRRGQTQRRLRPQQRSDLLLRDFTTFPQRLQLAADGSALADDVIDALADRPGLLGCKMRQVYCAQYEARRGLVRVERVAEALLDLVGLARVISALLPESVEGGQPATPFSRSPFVSRAAGPSLVNGLGAPTPSGSMPLAFCRSQSTGTCDGGAHSGASMCCNGE